ncbi:ATP-binding protein [Actinomadura fibrosa]|uniref:ATP-binding protein n=1 Tax=Actinomadura fibrosa TaxID=111802 RepID=A0ABW2XVZ3_9ACTN|nr:ATP-binding protein [Actinomadura fibrosa]
MRSRVRPAREIRIPASLTCLERVAEFVLSLGRDEDLPSDSVYRLRLATDEIVTNIIMHGYRERGGDIELRACADRAVIGVRVEDQAPPFDPGERLAAAVPPDLPLADREIGGLGLLLAARSLDDLRYEFVDGRNRNTLLIRRSRPKAW